MDWGSIGGVRKVWDFKIISRQRTAAKNDGLATGHATVTVLFTARLTIISRYRARNAVILLSRPSTVK
jgi:hypothetical protein